MGKIVLVSLLNGQDLVGEELDRTPDVIVLKRPMVVIAQQGAPNPVTGQPGIQLSLMPWPPLADASKNRENGLTINMSVVVTVTEPVDKVFDGYNDNVMGQSGLIVPRTPRLLTE